MPLPAASIQMFPEIDQWGTVKANRLKKGKHITGVPAHSGVDVPDSFLLKKFEESFGQDPTNSNSHVTGMDSNDFDPATLLQTKTFTFDLSNDEPGNSIIHGGDETHGFLFCKARLNHSDPLFRNLFLQDRFLDGNHLWDVVSSNPLDFDSL